MIIVLEVKHFSPKNSSDAIDSWGQVDIVMDSIVTKHL